MKIVRFARITSVDESEMREIFIYISDVSEIRVRASYGQSNLFLGDSKVGFWTAQKKGGERGEEKSSKKKDFTNDTFLEHLNKC